MALLWLLEKELAWFCLDYCPNCIAGLCRLLSLAIDKLIVLELVWGHKDLLLILAMCLQVNRLYLICGIFGWSLFTLSDCPCINTFPVNLITVILIAWRRDSLAPWAFFLAWRGAFTFSLPFGWRSDRWGRWGLLWTFTIVMFIGHCADIFLQKDVRQGVVLPRHIILKQCVQIGQIVFAPGSAGLHRRSCSCWRCLGPIVMRRDDRLDVGLVVEGDAQHRALKHKLR